MSLGLGQTASLEPVVVAAVYGKEKIVRLGFETMECKMMHDMFMQKGIKKI